MVYGCTEYFGGTFHEQYAILLSREKEIESEYVQQAKEKLESVGYQAGYLWAEPNDLCKFSAESTQEQEMITLLNSPPSWGDYTNTTST